MHNSMSKKERREHDAIISELLGFKTSSKPAKKSSAKTRSKSTKTTSKSKPVTVRKSSSIVRKRGDDDFEQAERNGIHNLKMKTLVKRANNLAENRVKYTTMSSKNPVAVITHGGNITNMTMKEIHDKYSNLIFGREYDKVSSFSNALIAKLNKEGAIDMGDDYGVKFMTKEQIASSDLGTNLAIPIVTLEKGVDYSRGAKARAREAAKVAKEASKLRRQASEQFEKERFEKEEIENNKRIKSKITRLDSAYIYLNKDGSITPCTEKEAKNTLLDQGIKVRTKVLITKDSHGGTYIRRNMVRDDVFENEIIPLLNSGRKPTIKIDVEPEPVEEVEEVEDTLDNSDLETLELVADQNEDLIRRKAQEYVDEWEREMDDIAIITDSEPLLVEDIDV
jgi:hypothetical protein